MSKTNLHHKCLPGRASLPEQPGDTCTSWSLIHVNEHLLAITGTLPDAGRCSTTEMEPPPRPPQPRLPQLPSPTQAEPHRVAPPPPPPPGGLQEQNGSAFLHLLPTRGPPWPTQQHLGGRESGKCSLQAISSSSTVRTAGRVRGPSGSIWPPVNICVDWFLYPLQHLAHSRGNSCLCDRSKSTRAKSFPRTQMENIPTLSEKAQLSSFKIY